jgi:hypothetical protein
VLATEPSTEPFVPNVGRPNSRADREGAARRNPLIPRLAQSEAEEQSRDPRRDETRRDENRSWCCGCDRGEGPPRLQMIDSKRFLPSLLPCKISPGAYIYIHISAIVCSAFSFPQWEPGLAGVFTANVPQLQHICSFFFFLLLRKAIKIGPCASHCSLPLATFDPQHTAKARRVPPIHPRSSVSSSSSGKLDRCRCWCWCHPIGIPWQPQFGLWQAPGTRIPGHVSLHRAPWLVNWNCCYSQSATLSQAAKPPRLPSTLHPQCWASLSDFST